ncbi:MAG: hypothetical protein E7680_02150 [Ruminococcaceae bacterium]|nr:hypothetical protein [Oscillospiraceae bacterium]
MEKNENENKGLKIDIKNRKILMNKAFEKAASIVGSEAYDLLQMARRDYPKYTVARRTIKKNPSKECYRGLTYDFIRDYIMRHPRCDQKLREFNELLELSKCHSIRYPRIKQWFLESYPEVEEYNNNNKQKYDEIQVA